MLIKAAQDRKYRFQLNKMFHDHGKSVEQADKLSISARFGPSEGSVLKVDVMGMGGPRRIF